MNAPGKCCGGSKVASPPMEGTVRELLEIFAGHAGKELKFEYDGRPIQAGYHVTEVKAANFNGLDCGANRESWSEILIQLWDIPEEAGKTPMSVSKFLAILRKFAGSVAFDPESKLTFEVSDADSAMRIYTYAEITIGDRSVLVSLEPRPASCKPRDRWLENTPLSLGEVRE